MCQVPCLFQSPSTWCPYWPDSLGSSRPPIPQGPEHSYSTGPTGEADTHTTAGRGMALRFSHTALVRGMQYGFRIRLQESLQCQVSTTTAPLAWEHAGVADQYILAQVSKGYIASPFPTWNAQVWSQAALQLYQKRTKVTFA